MRTLLTGTFLLLFGMGIAHAQTYSPDRPGIGNSSSVAPENVFGVEAGLEFTTTDFSNRIDIGQVLLRYGMTQNLELRAGLNSFTYINPDAPFDEVSGFNDMDIGAKYNFIQQSKDSPSLSAMVELSLPVGSDEFGYQNVTSTLSLLSDYKLNEMWSISSNLAYWFDTDNTDWNYWFFSLTPGFAIPSNEDLAGYFGYAGIYYGEGFNQHWLEAGLTYQLEMNTQLDINLGFDTDTDIFFIGAGFAKGFN